MPLHSKIDNASKIEIALWKVAERADYFENKLTIHESEKSIIEELSSRKLLEWLSSRYLLHLMSGRSDRGEFSKDIHGKPHLANSNFHISISHSGDMVAVAASEVLIGVDIQHYVEKIHRIQHKFVNEGEMENVPENKVLEAFHVIWGAKESLYKAYGKRSLDFKQNILIRELNLEDDTGVFYGKIVKEEYIKEFEINFNLFEKYALVYAKECN